MNSTARALADTLVAALWADGSMQDSEVAYLREKLGSLDIAPEDIEGVLVDARTSRSLKDVSYAGLTPDDKKRIFEEAFFMITSDRRGGGAERGFLKELMSALGFSAEEGKALTIAAAKVAKARSAG